MPTFTIKCTDANQPLCVRNLSSGRSYQIVLQRCQAKFIEAGDVLFHNNCAALLPDDPEAENREPSGDEDLQTGINVVAACLRYAEENSQKLVLVAGHTDTVGSADENTRLSHMRAKCVHGILAGDRDEFLTHADGLHLNARGKEAKAQVQHADRVQVLEWAARTFGWPCSLAQNYNDYFRAVKAFQKSYNESDTVGRPDNKPLAVDGDFGPKCWGATYDAYEVEIAKRLGVRNLDTMRAKLTFMDPALAGCGEYHPVDQAYRDEYKSQKNRRVEIWFFDPDEVPTLACRQGACQPKTCILYNPRYYSRKRLPIVLAGNYWILRTVESLNLQPNDKLILECQEAGYQQEVAAGEALVNNGYLEFYFKIGPAGNYHIFMQIGDAKYMVWEDYPLPAQPDDSVEQPPGMGD